jgi:hypothetical protein
MTTRTKNGLSILSLTFFFIIAVASSHKNAAFKDVDNWIPQDFNPTNNVLLIETHPVNNKQNERMIEWLEKNYPYRYEVVNKGVIENKISEKYSDTKTYPFGVEWELLGHRVTTQLNGQTHFETEWDLYGNFIDRSSNKVYKSTRKNNVYGQTAYIQFFNSVLGKFK